MTMDERVTRVSPEERIEGDPTPGMMREQAVDTEGVWGGLVRTQPGMTSAWHHHGEHETAIYVLAGALRVESGPSGAEVTEGRPGDFVHVPKGVIHRESNPSDEQSQLVVLRAGAGQPTINVDGPAPG